VERGLPGDYEKHYFRTLSHDSCQAWYAGFLTDRIIQSSHSCLQWLHSTF